MMSVDATRGGRILPAFLAGALMALAAFPAQAQFHAGPPPVTVAKPVVKDLIEEDEFTGRFEAAETVELRARVSGYLDKVTFEDGQIVKNGDLLFVIDKRPYEAALTRAEAEVKAAQTRLEFARGDFDRYNRLANRGTASERQMEQARQSFLQAQADMAALQSAVISARLSLSYTEIKSPLTGRIGRKLISEGNLVTADQTDLAVIVSIDPIHLYFEIDERSYIAYSRMGAGGLLMSASGGQQGLPVRAGLADEPDLPRQGRMQFLDNRMDASSGTMRARAEFANPDGFITPGLFARVEVPGSVPYRAVLVPDEAIFSDLDRRMVWVVKEDNSVEPRLIRPGPRHDGYRIVRSGLEGGETIVVSGLQRVRPGATVTPQMTELPASR